MGIFDVVTFGADSSLAFLWMYHLQYSQVIVNLIQMHTLALSLRSWLFLVSKYCLDYLSHRSDPLFTNCDNIWVGTGGLCFQWFFALITKTFEKDTRPLQMNSYFYNCISCWVPSAVLASFLLSCFYFAIFERGKKNWWRYDYHLKQFFIGLSCGIQCV